MVEKKDLQIRASRSGSLLASGPRRATAGVFLVPSGPLELRALPVSRSSSMVSLPPTPGFLPLSHVTPRMFSDVWVP